MANILGVISFSPAAGGEMMQLIVFWGCFAIACLSLIGAIRAVLRDVEQRKAVLQGKPINTVISSDLTSNYAIKYARVFNVEPVNQNRAESIANLLGNEWKQIERETISKKRKAHEYAKEQQETYRLSHVVIPPNTTRH